MISIVYVVILFSVEETFGLLGNFNQSGKEEIIQNVILQTIVNKQTDIMKDQIEREHYHYFIEGSFYKNQNLDHVDKTENSTYFIKAVLKTGFFYCIVKSGQGIVFFCKCCDQVFRVEYQLTR